MRAGLLRHRLVLQQQHTIDDGAAGNTTSYAEVATIWAGVTTSGGREFYQQKTLNPELTHQVEIRYRRGVFAGMRFLFGDAVLRIVSPLDPDGRRIRLLVMCQELVQ